jgi:hypothetical protein
LREEPSRAYKVVARFQIEDRGWKFTNAELERRVRMEAARVGGEAAIVEERTESHFVVEGLFIGHTAVVSQRVIVARAVVFTKHDDRAPGSTDSWWSSRFSCAWSPGASGSSAGSDVEVTSAGACGDERAPRR